MARDINTTLLGDDINKVMAGGISLHHLFEYKFQVHAADADVDIQYVSRIDISRNFATDYTDNIFIICTMAAGDFVRNVLPNRSYLECTFEFTVQDAEGKESENSWRCRAHIVDVDNKDLLDPKINKLSETELNNIGMVTVNLQLLYREYEVLQAAVASGNLEGGKVDDSIKMLFANYFTKSKPKIDGEDLHFALKMEEPANKIEYDYINIHTDPKTGYRPGLLQYIGLLQKQYGIYDSGCTIYLSKKLSPEGQIKPEKEVTEFTICRTTRLVYKPLTWPIVLVPGFEEKLKKLEEEGASNDTISVSMESIQKLKPNHLVILAAEDTVIADNADCTYKKEGENVFILPISKSDTVNPSIDNSIENGNAMVTLDQRSLVNRTMLQSTDEGDKNKMVIKPNNKVARSISTELLQEGVQVPFKDNIQGGLNEEQSTFDKLSGKYIGGCVSMTFTWNFGNPFIINPYDLTEVRIGTVDRGIISLVGSITNVIFTYDAGTKSAVCKLQFLGRANTISELPDFK